MLYRNKGRFLSGQKISEAIGCSRTAVWKHIRELIDSGYRIEAVQKSGYRLERAPEGIDEAALSAGLKTEQMGRRIVFSESMDSTQKQALRLAEDGAESGTLVITNEQTSGRGRLGHGWTSVRGKNITMSLIVRPGLPIEKTPQLTLITAVAAAETIERTAAVPCGIKWPNDILIEGKKIVGILTELQAEENRIKAVVIGIGMNVNTEASVYRKHRLNTATSLTALTGETYDLNRFVQDFLLNFEYRLGQFMRDGFTAIKPLWESRAVSLGKQIRVRRPGGHMLEGRAIGIDDEGVLLLEEDNGRIDHVYSADIDWS